MKRFIKNAVQLSVYHIAKQTVENIDKQMKKEDKDEKEVKSKMLIMGTIHTLLGIIYND